MAPGLAPAAEFQRRRRLQRYLQLVAEDLWTVVRLERLSSAEHDAVFDASIARTLDEVPSPFLERVRRRLEERLEEGGGRGSA